MANRTKITEARARAFVSADGREAVLWDTIASGLGLRMRPNGRKTWIVHRRCNGSVVRRTLGALDTLTDEEFRRLGQELDEVEAGGGAMAHAAVAIRLLLLTGCRKGEVLKLCWDDIDLAAREMRLRDAKTGPRTVQLSPAAAAALVRAPRVEGNPHVVPGMRPGSRMGDLQRPWERIRKRAGLYDLRLHDCRHSCATGAHLYEISSACRRREFLYPIVLVVFSKDSPQSPQRI